MRRNYSNTAVATTLAAGISDSDTSLTVTDATGYPDAPFTITIGSEVILVGAKDGTTFSSLTRGYDGTTAAAHDAGAAVEHAVVAEDMRVASLAPFGVRVMYPNQFTSAINVPKAGADVEPAQGHIYFDPIIFAERVRLVQVKIECRAAGSVDGVTEIALYSSVGILPAASPMIGPVTVDSTTTGSKFLVVDQAIPPGLYWIALRCAGYATPPKYFWRANDTHGFMGGAIAYDNGRNGLRSTSDSVGFSDYTLESAMVNTPYFKVQIDYP